MDTLIELGIALADVQGAYKRFFRAIGKADLADARLAAQTLRDAATSLAGLCDAVIHETELAAEQN